MLTDLAITSNQALYLALGLIGLVLAIIYLGRYYIRTKTSNGGLRNKYKGTDFDSPLHSRHKYPEVDVLHHTSPIFLLGLTLSLFILISAFGITTFQNEVFIPDNALSIDEDIEIEPPRSAEPPPPPPPPPPPSITEVPDEAILEEDEDLEFVDQSIEEQSVVEAPVEQPKETEEVAPPPPPPPPPPPEPDVEEIFQVVEEMPRFPGCEDISTKAEKYQCSNKKMLEFIYGNITYPAIAKENGVTGTVVIRFVVGRDGKITETEIVREIGATCGREALRVVNLMNQSGIVWHPGRQRGKAVKVRMNLPVKFTLLDN